MEKSGRSSSGHPNQGDRRDRRPRTPLGSPSRRPSSGEGGSSYHGKEKGEGGRRGNSFPSKNHYTS